MQRLISILAFLLLSASVIFGQSLPVINSFISLRFIKIANEICTNSESNTNCESNKETNKEVYYGNAFQPSNDWSVGPNPTRDVVYVYGNQDIIATIEVFSITGENLLILDKAALIYPIDLSIFPNGIYFIRIISDTNITKTYKVIKK